MNFNADVLPCLQNIEICIHKLKQLELLNRNQRCPNCQEMCFWTKYSKSKDGWAWKCQTKLCQNYKNYISIRKGSFFANSNIPLPKWLHLMYLWATKASNKQTQLSHRTVNHSINFVEPITGVHTQNIESYWNVKKTLIKKMRGCQRKLLHWYLQEYMWRDRFDRNNNAFDNIVGHINLFYQF